jgi:hypothetical protein
MSLTDNNDEEKWHVERQVAIMVTASVFGFSAAFGGIPPSATFAAPPAPAQEAVATQKATADLPPEKKDLALLKASLEYHRKQVTELEKEEAAARQVDSRALKQVADAEKAAMQAKKAFVNANDKLSEAKSKKKGPNTIVVLKNQVGEYSSTEAACEKPSRS